MLHITHMCCAYQAISANSTAFDVIDPFASTKVEVSRLILPFPQIDWEHFRKKFDKVARRTQSRPVACIYRSHCKRACLPVWGGIYKFSIIDGRSTFEIEDRSNYTASQQ